MPPFLLLCGKTALTEKPVPVCAYAFRPSGSRSKNARPDQRLRVLTVRFFLRHRSDHRHKIRVISVPSQVRFQYLLQIHLLH